MRWHAFRAAGKLAFQQMLQIVDTLFTDGLHERFAMTGDGPEFGARAGLYLSLVARTIWTRAWSLWSFEQCLPYSFAVVGSEDAGVAAEGLQRIRTVSSALAKLEALLDAPATCKHFKNGF